MTKANALRGWRSPEEKPIKGVSLLVAFRAQGSGYVSVQQINLGLEHAMTYYGFDVLGWQYCPRWENEEKEKRQ